MNRELVKFGAFQAVGVATTVVALPLMAAADALGVPYPVYTGLNYLFGLVAGYFLNLRFTFADQGAPGRRASLRYFTGFLGLMAAVQGLQYGLISWWGWPRWVGVGTGMAVYAVMGYLLSRHWVFRGPRPMDDKVLESIREN